MTEKNLCVAEANILLHLKRSVGFRLCKIRRNVSYGVVHIVFFYQKCLPLCLWGAIQGLLNQTRKRVQTGDEKGPSWGGGDQMVRD